MADIPNLALRRNQYRGQAMTRLLTALPLILLSGAAFGKTFECSEAFATAFGELTGEKAPVLVVATVNADGKTGTIKVADQEFQANYQVEGLDRTWRFFTADNQEYGYMFLISPDGTAAYYDHETSEGEPTYPDQAYLCRERKIEVSAPAIAEGEAPQALDQDELAAYQFAIAQKIRRNWSVPASASPDTLCVVNVRQLAGGEIVGVNIISCNGDDAVKRSVEAAIHRSSPLPEPSDPDLFSPILELILRPEREN